MIRIATVQTTLLLLLLIVCSIVLLPKKPLHTIAIQIPQAQPTPTPQLPHTFLMNPQILAANKIRIQQKDPTLMPAYNNLIKQADKLLTQKPVSVMDKTQTPPSGNKHDYMSLAPYAWPNPNAKNGLPYITKDGQTNPEINTISDIKNLHNIIIWVNTLALAYYFSDNNKYGHQAALFIKTWFIDRNTKMNPNLNYAQIKKGNIRGNSGGIIDTYGMPQIIDAINILNDSNIFTYQEKSALNLWFKDYLSWLQTSQSGKDLAQAKNNQRTWYDDQLISISLFLNQPDIARQIAINDRDMLIAQQMDQEGEQVQELTRTKSWDYSNFNLLALCNLADLSNNAGVNLWHYQTKDGKSIKKATDYLITYATNDKPWPYKQIIPFNKNLIIAPLTNAASGLNNIQYWNDSMDLQGKNAENNINLLIYQKPN